MLLKESDLCERLQKEVLLQKVEEELQNFELLMKWSILPEQPIGWRAAWLLRQISKKNDIRLQSHINLVIENYPSFNESQKREWLKNLVDQTLNEDQEGVLFELCIEDWMHISYHPALRASALQLAFAIAKKYLDLKTEIRHLITPDYLSTLSPGIKKSILKNWELIDSKED